MAIIVISTTAKHEDRFVIEIYESKIKLARSKWPERILIKAEASRLPDDCPLSRLKMSIPYLYSALATEEQARDFITQYS